MVALVLAAAMMQQASLTDAVLYGDTKAVQSLIAGGADVNAMDETGMTPLMVAASEGRTAIARMLIAAGASVKASSKDGSDALMRAASANRVDVMKLLIAGGADANATSGGGMTALMVAAFGGYADAVRALLASRANPNAKDSQGRTAMMAAATSGDAGTVEALIGAGGDPAIADAGGSTPLTYAAAEGHAEAMAVLRKGGLKAGPGDLALAAAGCHSTVVRSILADGVNVNGAEGDVVPLVSAAGDSCVEVVQMLLDRGARVDAKDHDGRTALIKASQAGHLEMVRLLLQHGADINIRDGNGRTGWTFAAMSGRLDIAELFKQARAAHIVPQPLEVTSTALKADQPIPKQYTADGRNDSPPLAWSGVPDGTKSLAVVCEDPDAGNPPPFAHWLVYNIPPDANGLPEAIPFEPDQPMPKEIAGSTQGVSGFRRPIYRGPAPPPDKMHHYHFVVYALDMTPDLKPGLTRADLLEAINGHILGQGELIATYERK